MTFCPKCDNFRDISKNSNQLIVDETPTSISNSDQNTSTLINKILNNVEITEEERKQLDSGIYSAQEFNVLSNKHKNIIKKYIQNLEQSVPEDTNAYFKCNVCTYCEPIKSGTIALSKSSELNMDFIEDTEKYRDYVYSNILPRTKNYICPNSACKTHKNAALKKAIFFRKYHKSLVTMYICAECKHIWRIA